MGATATRRGWMVSRKQDYHSTPRNTVDDAALLARYAAGEMRAAGILTKRLGGNVMAHAYHRMQNHADAEDITQEAFLRLWKIAPDWEHGRARVSTWLYRVVENLCIDRLRKRREVGLENAADMQAAPVVATALDETKRVGALYDAIESLPPRQAEAIRLRHLLELSNPAIAARMEIGVEAVESLLARGRRKLSSLLAARKHDLGYGDDD